MAEHHEEQVEVAVHSNAGRYPEHGVDHVPASQKVIVELEQAATALGITNLNGWIAKVGTKEIDPQLSYQQNGLKGHVVIDLGPRESGGGNA